ncbi:glutamine--fructose-6-phosphate transaminase [Granulicatella balaenopterae]|uniref:Glutamine--fructose-6-phosphate aminotransferase [isomerizing] n=1 Tax=Granulicatella balaenopterae TaxID=137733 RepID=A0A1H9H8Q5_9LACT|nr:glutamine--fructose-6-phosphate transaminase (isomerizing) [Granulicatella balaenopterae]SEQ58637.1 glutamine--fructose-6-phosphate transaminase [Granulicatella balaenopterae]
MCGIVGVIGHKNAQSVIINGLEKLEYRGYDSAGMFLTNNEEDSQLTKVVGRIEGLKEATKDQVNFKTGIGHTRWATHGPATKDNAHPHVSQSGRFTIVHNGVIENYQELREKYLKDVTFKSQTDTEVIVNLVEYFALKEDLTAKEAFRKALKEVKGSYALGLLDNEEPGVLYAAKNKSPLLIGVGEDFNVICSDAMATINETDQYLEIKDKELITLTANSVEIETLDGEKVERMAYTAELDANDLEKGTYPHFMLKEMDEQPAVLRRIIKEYTNEAGELAVPQELIAEIKQAERIYVVACGTSYHAGWVGKELLESLAHIPVEVFLASEFSYNQPLLVEKPFFIFLTQSGETADSRQALVKVNEQNYPSLTITNVKGSTLSREANHTLLLHAGPEIAVASTKAYTAQMTVMAILAESLRREKGIEKSFDMAHELGVIATVIEGILSDKEDIHEIVKKELADTRNAFYIGRHMDYYVAMEAALKLKEISYIQTESFAAGELKHGTIALIEEGTPVIALINEDNVASHTRGNIQEVKARGARTMVVAMEKNAIEGDDVVISNVEEMLSPLTTVVVTQLIAYYASLDRGLDVDKPRNLAKSVTVE